MNRAPIRLSFRLPLPEVIFTIIEDLAGLSSMLVNWASISWDNRRVIQEFQETATMLGEDDLLLCTLNSCSKFGCICLLELLTSLKFG